MTYLSTIWPSDLRPRVIGEAIVIGRDTVLARHVDSQGLWTLDRPRPAVTARLTLSDGSTVMGYDGKAMAEPNGVSLKDNILWVAPPRRYLDTHH